MKTIERVFEILNKEKVELKAEKVELGVDDYKQYEKNLFKIRKEIEELVSKYASMKKQLIDIRQKTGKLSVQSSKILQEAEAQAKKDFKIAKELGVDVSIISKPFQRVKNDANENEKIAERLVQTLAKIR